jgi:iron complex transport system substrate-binding protein
MAAVTRLRRALALGLLLSSTTSAFADVRVVDDAGAPVTLVAPARRIVTLAPHAAEIVHAAGAGDRIVGVVKGTDYPPAAAARPVIGDAVALDLERIVALAPDLIVTWPWTTPAQVSWLRARGIAVFEADPRAIDGIATDIERIGTLADTSPAAATAARELRTRIARYEAQGNAGLRLRVFYQVSDAPLFTLGGKHLVSEAIARCGGENVFSGLSIPAPQVSVEAVLAADPQVIVAGTDNARRPAWLDAWSRWPSLAAVRLGNLFVVDANLLHRPGPRFVDGIAQLCRALAEARQTIAAASYNDHAGATSGAVK